MKIDHKQCTLKETSTRSQVQNHSMSFLLWLKTKVGHCLTELDKFCKAISLTWIGFKKKSFIHFYLVDYFFNFEFTSLSERYMKPGISKWQHDHWVCTMAQVIIYLRWLVMDFGHIIWAITNVVWFLISKGTFSFDSNFFSSVFRNL